MAMSMKGAANLQMISRTVVSALRTQGPDYASDIEEKLYPNESSPPVSVDGFMGTLADHLERSVGEVSRLVSEVLNEGEESKQATAAVGEGVDELRDNVMETEDLINGTYGRGSADDFGFAGTTPYNPDELVVASKQLERALRNRPLPAQTRRGRPALDGDLLADALAADRQKLEAAMEHNKTEDRQTQQARAARDEAVESWQFAYRGVANIATGLFFLARATDLAERVRATGRRRRGEPEEEDLEPADADAPAADEPVEA